MSASAETAKAMERADRSGWGKAKRPGRWGRLRLACGFLGMMAALVSGAWACAELAELSQGRWPWAVGLGVGAYGLFAGAWCFPMGELALGLAMGASLKSSARVAGRSLSACGWIAAGMLGMMASIIALPIAWGAKKAAKRVGWAGDWAVGARAWEWLERGRLKMETVALFRAEEFGPLAAWAEARRLARSGGHDALRRAVECWRLNPFDPGWEMAPKEMISELAKRGGEPDRGWIAWSRWARPRVGALLDDFWPDAGEMQAALEAAVLEREAGSSERRETGMRASGGRL